MCEIKKQVSIILLTRSQCAKAWSSLNSCSEDYVSESFWIKKYHAVFKSVRPDSIFDGYTNHDFIIGVNVLSVWQWDILSIFSHPSITVILQCSSMGY